MTLGFQANVLQRVTNALAAQLGNAEVFANAYLNPEIGTLLGTVQNLLPRHGPALDRAKKYVAEMPLVEFVYGRLARELYEQRESLGNAKVALSTLPEYEDVAALSRRLISEFESLPWEYRLTVPAPATTGWTLFRGNESELEVSDGIRLVRPNGNFRDTFPLQSANPRRDAILTGRGLLSPPLEWRADSTYLQIDALGYVTTFQTEPLIESLATLKAICGLGIGIDLIHATDRTSNVGRVPMLAHRRAGDAWQIETRYDLGTSLSDGLLRLELHPGVAGQQNEEARIGIARHKLRLIGKVIAAGDRASRIARGAQWLFDSFCGTDELLQYVQAAVVVEILLGDKARSDQIGLSELLANRCAYLIADTRNERDELLKDFKLIYEVRSKIVHTGKSRLSATDRELFSKLLSICRRIIAEEVRLLDADIPPLGEGRGQ